MVGNIHAFASAGSAVACSLVRDTGPKADLRHQIDKLVRQQADLAVLL